MPAENKTMTAQWTPNNYTISFAANAADATGTMTPMSCTYDVPTNLTPCAFNYAGYAFVGWTNSVGDVFVDGALVSNLTATANGTVTLYAQWAENGYTVTLDAGDGIGFMTNSVGEEVSVISDFTVAIGCAWNLPTAVTNINSDLVFAGWAYVKEGVTNALPSVVPPLSEGVTNLVATWGDAFAVALDAPNLVFSTKGTVGGGLYLDESSYDAKWFAQANCGEVSGTSAAQSGALPQNVGNWNVYVSWLTTTVEGKGVLSFSWKRDAKPIVDDYGDLYGDILRFGTVSGTQFTELPEVSELIENIGWQNVTYTNNQEGPITFAWAFMYRDGGYNNGGGTGYIDRVTWTPSE